MPNRERYSEVEVRAILKRAAERQHRADLTAEARANGLSLADLERAAAAAGIEPEHVAAAIRDAERVEPELEASFSDRIIGRPTRLHNERFVPGRLDDALWQKLVLELRRTFDTTGTPSTLGALHEWRSDSQVQKNLAEFQAEEVGGEVRLTLQRSWAGQAGGTVAWLVLGGGFSAFFMMIGFLEAASGTSLIAIVISLLVGVLGFTLTRGWYRRLLDKQAVRSERLLDRLEGIVANHQQAGELEEARAALQAQPVATSEARLDLDAAEYDAVEYDDSSAERSRQRTRQRT